MSLMDRITGKDTPKDEVDALAAVLPLRASAAPYSEPRAITASAEKINLNRRADINSMTDRPFKVWQRDAWVFYDAIGEIKYAFTLLGSVTSRIRLHPAVIIDPDAQPQSTTMIRRRKASQTDAEKTTDTSEEMDPLPEVTPEVMKYMEQLLTELGNGNGGIPGMLRAYALNLSVPGECYLCKIDGRWSIKSTEEISIRETDSVPVLRTIRSQGNRTTGSTNDRPLPKNTYIGRIWKSHPRYSGEPDSSMLGLLEMCDELLTLQRMIRAVARSKMNAGMVFIPDGISASATSVTETIDEAEEEVDPFEQEFMQAMITPVGDESSASTVSPLLARGEGDLGNMIKYIKFDREADRHLVERADRTLERILQGIDVPKDIITGLANVKYSNAVQIDEGLYKSHIEPLALLFCDSLTAIYLRPALKAKFPDLSEEALASLIIWYDPTEVVTKPDPAHAAEKLYDNFEISGNAFRRAFGFSDTDKPDEDELANRMALKQTAPPPELVAALIKHLLPSVFKEQQAVTAGKNVPQSAQQMLYGDQQAGASPPDGSFSDAPTPPPLSNEPSAAAPPDSFGTDGQPA